MRDLLTLLQSVTPPQSGWPVTVSGWVALFTSITTAIVMLVGGTLAWGKWLDRMNGFGERLKLVEDKQERDEGADVERLRQFDAVMAEQRHIVAAVARAEKAAESCRTEADQHALEIGSRTIEVINKLNSMELALAQRLTAVETKLGAMSK